MMRSKPLQRLDDLPVRRLLRRPACGTWLVSLLLPLMLAGSTSLLAAEAEPKVESEAPAGSEQSAEQPSNTDADEAVFKPSEEISEDFAVSFPVDI